MQQQQYARRTSNRFTGKVFTVAGALTMALVLSASYHLDGPADYSAEWQRADAMMDAQNTAAAMFRKEAAGQAACEELRGFNATASFDADGSLLCAAGRTVIKASL